MSDTAPRMLTDEEIACVAGGTAPVNVGLTGIVDAVGTLEGDLTGGVGNLLGETIVTGETALNPVLGSLGVQLS